MRLLYFHDLPWFYTYGESHEAYVLFIGLLQLELDRSYLSREALTKLGLAFM